MGRQNVTQSDFFSGLTPENVVQKFSLEHITYAAQRLSGIVKRTPTLRSDFLTHMLGDDVYLKLENLQTTGSFKVRGAYMKIIHLSEEEKARGIITMSAGNHAQGVAYHAQKLGISAIIVMPENTPITKIERTRALGASVILHGETMSESRDFVMQLIKKHNYTLIHTFDDPYIIAGQGTVGLEMLEDVPNLDVLIVPVGGGGLSAGICVAAKQMNPKIQIMGVQAEYCSAVAQVLFPNVVPEHIKKPPLTIAEGIAIKFPGVYNLALLEKYMDDMLVVSESYIESAVELLAVNEKIVVEGAGAAGVAALMYGLPIFKGKRVGIVICGGNIDARILSNLLLRGMVQHGRLVKYRIEITDAPGILGRLTQIIGRLGGNIFEISHQRLFNNTTVKMAFLDAVVETRDGEHAHMIRDSLTQDGFSTEIIDIG